MAEVFGVASAAIGVAAAAGQLINGIMELRSFCSQVKSIPDDVQAAVDDLATMAEVLEFIQVEMSHQTLSYGLSAQAKFVRATANLRQSSQQVGEVLKEMQAKLGKKNPLGRIIAVGMKQRLQKATKQVESAQRLFLILLAVENRMTIRQSLTSPESQLAVMSAGVLPTLKNNEIVEETPEDQAAKDDNDSYIKTSQRSEAVILADRQFLQRSFKANSRYTASWTLPLPKILSKSLWEFSVYKATQGWNFHLRTYTLRPLDAPIFKAIRNGDIGQVNDLLRSGAASLGDRDYANRGLLHIAALSCRSHGPSIIEYLLQNGADIYSVDMQGLPPYFRLPSIDHDYMENEEEGHLVSAYKAFTTHRDWIPAQPTLYIPYPNSQMTTPTIDFFPIFNNPPEEIIQSVLSEMQPPWTDMSLTDRINMLFPDLDVDSLTGTVNPVSVRACLSRDDIRENFAGWDTKNQDKRLRYSVQALAEQLVLKNERGTNEARLFLKDIYATGIYSIQGLAKMDPMRLFVHSHTMQFLWKRREMEMHRTLVDAVQEGLKKYISEMMLLRIDMALLIEIEKVVLARQDSEADSVRAIWRLGYPFKIFKVDSGPKVEDWYLWLSNPLDEWAGDFWDLVEHPERTIPGTWVED